MTSHTSLARAWTLSTPTWDAVKDNQTVLMVAIASLTLFPVACAELLLEELGRVWLSEYAAAQKRPHDSAPGAANLWVAMASIRFTRLQAEHRHTCSSDVPHGPCHYDTPCRIADPGLGAPLNVRTKRKMGINEHGLGVPIQRKLRTDGAPGIVYAFDSPDDRLAVQIWGNVPFAGARTVGIRPTAVKPNLAEDLNMRGILLSEAAGGADFKAGADTTSQLHEHLTGDTIFKGLEVDPESRAHAGFLKLLLSPALQTALTAVDQDWSADRGPWWVTGISLGGALAPGLGTALCLLGAKEVHAVAAGMPTMANEQGNRDLTIRLKSLMRVVNVKDQAVPIFPRWTGLTHNGLQHTTLLLVGSLDEVIHRKRREKWQDASIRRPSYLAKGTDYLYDQAVTKRVEAELRKRQGKDPDETVLVDTFELVNHNHYQHSVQAASIYCAWTRDVLVKRKLHPF